MFQSIKSRLAIVACGAWAVAAWFVDHRIGEYLMYLVAGWALIWLATYGAAWVMDSPGVTLPKLPRWAAYTLIGIMVFLIMGLPKVIF